MKKWKKFLASVITGVVLFSSSVCNVSAASANGVVQKQAYTYKVTIFAGNQGGFSGTNGLAISNKDAVVVQTEDKLIISGLNYGDEVSYTAQTDVKLDASSKYYVKGIRLGGRDNDTVAAAAFLVRGDMDYVVAYGIKGNQVSYTVNYHDENGKEMLPSEVFYGNVGDKPVIACKYIEGYEPQASGLTKTLKENAAENVFVLDLKCAISLKNSIECLLLCNGYSGVDTPEISTSFASSSNGCLASGVNFKIPFTITEAPTFKASISL